MQLFSWILFQHSTEIRFDVRRKLDCPGDGCSAVLLLPVADRSNLYTEMSSKNHIQMVSRHRTFVDHLRCFFGPLRSVCVSLLYYHQTDIIQNYN